MKRFFSLLLALALLLPVFSLAEEDDDLSFDDIEEDVILEDDGTETEDPDSIGEEFYMPSEEQEEALLALDAEVDDTVDPDSLDLNTQLPDDVLNILLLGVDTHIPVTRDESGKIVQKNIIGLADTQIILSINKSTGEIKMTSILRDSYVSLPGYKQKNKINVSFQYGCNKLKLSKAEEATRMDEKTSLGAALAMRTVNKNFEMNIQHYVAINFSGLSGIIDALGGIDIDMSKKEASAVNKYINDAYKLPNKFTYDPGYDRKLRKNPNRVPLEAKAGIQHCDGIQALTYARLRSIDNDFMRSNRQRHLLDLLLKDVLQKFSLDTMDALLEVCFDYAATNINASTFFDLAVSILRSGITSRVGQESSLFEDLRIPMDGTYSYKDITVNGGKSSVTTYNVKKQTRAIHEFIYGSYYPAD